MLQPDTANQIITPEDTGDTNAVHALTALHTRTVDALAGYEMMVEEAEPEFRDTAEAFRVLHARHADQVAGMLAHHGHATDADGSFMGSVNKAVVAMRAFFDEIDADVMSSISNGEDHVLKAFGDAIQYEAHPKHQQELLAMRDALNALLQRTRSLD